MPGGFSKTREQRVHAGFRSRQVVARLLEIQAETTMNHILIDSTGVPRNRLLPPAWRARKPRGRKDVRVWHRKESRLVVHRGKAPALEMKNRRRRNLFNGRPRLAPSLQSQLERT